MKELIKEARSLANEINLARLEGRIPSAVVTARLVTVSKLLKDAQKKPPVFSEYAPSEGV